MSKTDNIPDDLPPTPDQDEKPKKQTLRQRSLLSEQSKKYDPDATPEDCIENLRAVQKADPDAFITMNWYRLHGKYSDATWIRHFGSFLEFRRQAKLELNRHQHKVQREVAKHASLDIVGDFYETEVLPYHQKYEKDHKGDILSLMVCSDLHDMEIDEFCLSVFLDQCYRVQPHIIVLNGDIYDNYEFSKFDADPRKVKPVERMKFVLDRVFRPLRQACPNSQIDMIIGNHEYRILKIMANATPNLKAVLSDFVGLGLKDIFGLDEFKINLITKLDLKAWTKKDVKDQLTKNYKIYAGCYVVCHKPLKNKDMSGTNGHLHQAELRSYTSLTRGRCTWMQTPAMHSPDAEYIEGVDSSNMGFGEVLISKSTQEVIQKPQVVHQTWAHINGVMYRRKVD